MICEAKPVHSYVTADWNNFRPEERLKILSLLAQSVEYRRFHDLVIYTFCQKLPFLRTDQNENSVNFRKITQYLFKHTFSNKPSGSGH